MNKYTAEIEELSTLALRAETKKRRDAIHKEIDKVYEKAWYEQHPGGNYANRHENIS